MGGRAPGIDLRGFSRGSKLRAVMSAGNQGSDEPGYDVQKVDDTALAFLHLTTFREGPGLRAWKGLDWEVLDRLHTKGWISDPRSKARSVVVTEEGAKRSEALFRELFGKPSRNAP